MAVRLKPVEEQVIVLTGASSGIGLATARAAADRGARSSCSSSRNDDACRTWPDEVEARGGQAVAAPADVANLEDLERVAASRSRSVRRLRHLGQQRRHGGLRHGRADPDRGSSAHLRGELLGRRQRLARRGPASSPTRRRDHQHRERAVRPGHDRCKDPTRPQNTR